jgi:hypothetical protein
MQPHVRDGQRASQVIASVRALFKKDTQTRTPVDVDDLLREALALVDGELQNQKIVLQTRFAGGLPPAGRPQG